MKSDSIQADETRQHQENIEQHNRDMEITEKKQLKYQRLAFICSFLSMLFMGAVLAIVIMAAMYLGPRVETIYNSTMVSLENLEKLTNELNAADLSGTVKHIDELTVQATEGLTDTMARLDTIDLEKLNTAIGNLNATIEPLANFFGVLSR